MSLKKKNHACANANLLPKRQNGEKVTSSVAGSVCRCGLPRKPCRTVASLRCRVAWSFALNIVTVNVAPCVKGGIRCGTSSSSQVSRRHLEVCSGGRVAVVALRAYCSGWRCPPRCVRLCVRACVHVCVTSVSWETAAWSSPYSHNLQWHSTHLTVLEPRGQRPFGRNLFMRHRWHSWLSNLWDVFWYFQPS